jgi:hypothetical protein
MTHISDIKLIRTDTTLDLSQKAEKGMNCSVHIPLDLYPPLPAQLIPPSDVVLIDDQRLELTVRVRLAKPGCGGQVVTLGFVLRAAGLACAGPLKFHACL